MRPNLNSKKATSFSTPSSAGGCLIQYCLPYVCSNFKHEPPITVIALPKLNNNNNHFHSFSFFITKILQRFWWMFRVHWLIIFKTILIKHLVKMILIIKIFFKLFCTIKNCLKLKIFLTYFKYNFYFYYFIFSPSIFLYNYF